MLKGPAKFKFFNVSTLSYNFKTISLKMAKCNLMMAHIFKVNGQMVILMENYFKEKIQLMDIFVDKHLSRKTLVNTIRKMKFEKYLLINNHFLAIKN